MSADQKTGDGRELGQAKQFAYDRLDRAMHERARLGIMTSLMAHPEGVFFPQLKRMCDLTDGNLKRHLDVLVEESLVQIDKEPVGNRLQSKCRLLPRGKERFLDYLEELQRVLHDASAAAGATLAGTALTDAAPLSGKAPAATSKRVRQG